jgi:4-carboxymuconolactone decarboxylase
LSHTRSQMTCNVFIAAILLIVAAVRLRAQSNPPAQPHVSISSSASRPAVAGPEKNFTGSVSVKPLFGTLAPARTTGGVVTFAQGARSAWHTHPLGQTLIITEGTGWIQEWGGPIQVMHKGDVITIPAGVKHWHGATATTAVTHIAIQEVESGKNVEWLEKVSDEQYRSASPQSH